MRSQIKSMNVKKLKIEGGLWQDFDLGSLDKLGNLYSFLPPSVCNSNSNSRKDLRPKTL